MKTVRKGKSRSSMRGRTKTRRTKRTRQVTLGARRYSVPVAKFEKLQEDLAPHLVDDDRGLSFDEFFKEADANLPEWAIYLRGLRYRENLTQLQFGEAIGTTQGNVSAMENGRRQIGKDLAKRIAEAFDTDYRYFL